jgi:hypothetical protein
MFPAYSTIVGQWVDDEGVATLRPVPSLRWRSFAHANAPLMNLHPYIPALAVSVAFTATLQAQTTLKDGTALQWDKQINVATDSLRNDSVNVPALSIPVYEAGAGQVVDLLKKAVPGANFKKQGDQLKASNASFGTGGAPMDLLAKVVQDKKAGLSKVSLAFLKPGTSNSAALDALQPAVRNLAVDLNKAVVQGQLDEWKKKLGKADSKTSGAAKEQDKAQGKLDKAQAQLGKTAKEKSKLQGEHAILQKEIDLYNQKWTLSQDPKDLKKLTKARTKIQKNEASMAKVLQTEAKTQQDLSEATANLPDAQRERDAKAAAQAEVQRTVDALQRKWESIR